VLTNPDRLVRRTAIRLARLQTRATAAPISRPTGKEKYKNPAPAEMR
jgi:hypothetical protein